MKKSSILRILVSITAMAFGKVIMRITSIIRK